MRKAICFGAAGGAKRLFGKIKEKYDVIAFADNDFRKIGEELFGLPICSLEQCLDMNYDLFIITSAPGMDSIKKQLLDKGVPEEKIITSYIEAPLESRRIFLNQLSMLHAAFDKSVEVAEAGVFEGDFAKWINQYYPDRKCHLFDTFEGFNEKDIVKEGNRSEARVGDYSNTTVEMVMGKMPFPQNIEVHKGYFPETAKGINSKFCFVNLDLDLYEPTYQGLIFFCDKMVSGGVILVHDYFAENFKGPKEAVDKFINECKGKYQIFPIGDGISIMITGF